MTDSRTKNVRQSSDNEHSSRLQLRKLIRVPFSSLVQKIGHANFLSSDKARYLGCQYTFIIGSCHDPFILSADGETVTHLEFHWCFKEEDHSTSTFMHLRQFSSEAHCFAQRVIIISFTSLDKAPLDTLPYISPCLARGISYLLLKLACLLLFFVTQNSTTPNS